MHGEFMALDDYKFAIFLNNLNEKYDELSDELINRELEKAWKIGKKMEE